jgi:hypothetical protein
LTGGIPGRPIIRAEHLGAVWATRHPALVSGVLPGSTHDLTAARELVLPQARPYLKDLPFLADSGYEGAGAGVHVPVRKLAGIKELDPDTRTGNVCCCGPCVTRANAASR